MAKKKMVCGPGMHSPHCVAVKLIILGVLIVLNAVYGWFGWGVFVGGIIGIKGLLMLAHPCCK